MGKMDSEKFKTGMSGEKMPKGVLSSDTSGERMGKIKGGVGMGKENKTEGMECEMKKGNNDGVRYEKETHKKGQREKQRVQM